MTTRSKTWLFRFIAILIPFAFVGLIELSLRLVGFGQSPPLFIPNPAHPDYLLTRPDVVKRYFPFQEDVPNVTLEPHFFLKDKPNNGVRIFVQGGSTAAGYPYGLGASIAGMLEHRLRASLPGKHVEVVNTALSAVNSYTLLDFADEIIAQQPDAVLIYAGHNEYLGLLGSGSRFAIADSHAVTLLQLALKDWRIYQLIQWLVAELSSTTADTKAITGTSSRTVMAQVAQTQNIEYGSEAFAAGKTQFKDNLTLLLDKYQQANIPVFISTIASNEKDFAPFVSAPLSAEHTKLLKELPSSYASLAEQADTATHAALAYQLGQFCLATRQTCAQAWFSKARDYDALRFRAPSHVNDIIRSFADKQVFIVDSEARLRGRDPQGFIGNNVMLEHLHPNVSGYFVIANAFYDRLVESEVFDDIRTIDVNTAWQRRPIIPAEEYAGFADVQVLMSDYPFTDFPQPVKLPAPSNADQHFGLLKHRKELDWLGMMKQAQRYYINQKDTQMVTKVTQIIADALPHDPMANLKAGQYLAQAERFAEALYYYERAQRAGALQLEQTIATLKTKSQM